MIQITPQMRILVAVEAVDGRKGIDSLARLCQERLQTYGPVMEKLHAWLHAPNSRKRRWSPTRVWARRFVTA
jgi:hypothetical protein